jgi:hypothetical protein
MEPLTIEKFMTELANCKPGMVPFDPYVIGMKREVMPLIFEDPCVGAAGNIFVNDLGMAHDQVQSLEGNETAAYLHGIIHRREGDFENANYWFRQAKSLALTLGVDPHALTNEVEQSTDLSGELRTRLVDEWKSLVSFIIQELGNPK